MEKVQDHNRQNQASQRAETNKGTVRGKEMANEENLVPQNKRTKKEQREIASKGGIKSGQVRKDKKIITNTLELLLKSEIQDVKIKEELEKRGIVDHTELKAMCLGMVAEARKNPSAFKEILDRIEGKVTDKLQVDAEINNPYKGLSEDDLRKLAKK